MGLEAYLPRPYCDWHVGGTRWEQPIVYDVVGLGNSDGWVSGTVTAQDSNHVRRMIAFSTGGTALLIAWHFFLNALPQTLTIGEELSSMAVDLAKATGIGAGVAALTYTLASRLRGR